MMLRTRNYEEVDPRVLEVEVACRSKVLTKLTESFSNPEDTLAWMVISWTLSFLVISIFNAIQSSALLACFVAVALMTYRKKYCISQTSL
jgi:hypothetical protein